MLCATALAGCWPMWALADGGFDRYHLPKELALSLMALLCMLLFMRTHGRITWDRIDQLALASLSMAALSSLLATSPALAVRSWSLELAVTVLFLTARSLDTRHRSLLLVSVVLAALGVALVALAESFGLLTGLSRAGRAPGATLGQRNMVAHLLVLTAPSAWWLASCSRGALLRGFACLASACTAAVLLLTRSRAGWLGYGAALLAFVTLWLWQTRAAPLRERRALALPLACALLGLLLALCVPTRLAWQTPRPYADTLARLVDVQGGSGAGRLAQYRASLALVPLHPGLGAGPGNWMVEYPRVAPAHELSLLGHGYLHTGRLANSDWIAWLSERGLLGSGCALWLALTLCWSARKRPERVLAWATAAALLVVGALDAVLQLPGPACLTALLFALAAPRADSPPSAGKFSRVLPCVALCLSLSWTGWGATRRALGLWARTRPVGGFAAMESAVSWNGSDLFARFSLAEAYVLRADCAAARPHLSALRELLPYHHAPKALACVERR